MLYPPHRCLTCLHIRKILVRSTPSKKRPFFCESTVPARDERAQMTRHVVFCRGEPFDPSRFPILEDVTGLWRRRWRHRGTGSVLLKMARRSCLVGVRARRPGGRGTLGFPTGDCGSQTSDTGALPSQPHDCTFTSVPLSVASPRRHRVDGLSFRP